MGQTWIRSARRGKRKNGRHPAMLAVFLARKEGFEPSRRFYPAYSLSRGAPSASWVLPQVDGKIQLAERVGFEPTDAFTSPVFKTGAFDHSAISPFVKANLCQKQIRFYHPRSRLSTQNARSLRINISRRSRGYFLCGQSPMLPATPHAALVRSDICMGLVTCRP